MNDPNTSRRLSSEKTIRAVEKLARTDPRLAEPADVWDRDEMVINTPAGLLDLQTDEMSGHSPDNLITRITGASPAGQCPRFLTFLDEITGSDADLIDYLQRVAGYCLTGSMKEQVFFFLHGTGANGKSVFLSILSTVLGDYAATAPLDAFAATQGDRHPTDLAGLVKARAVIVTETEPGKAWMESRIKAITGGDKVRVRFLYQDFFEIAPSFKIIVAGNSRPRMTGVGEAMKRRLHLIPFDVTIPAENRQTDLIDQLLAEKDGIFAWMLEGCAAWQRDGLRPPRRVADAAAEYFLDEDLTGQWIAEACETGPNLRASAASLYSSWKRWAEPRGFDLLSQRTLGEELRTRGFKSYRTGRERGWLGLRPNLSGLPITGDGV